jgi:hypothetical protein
MRHSAAAGRLLGGGSRVDSACFAFQARPEAKLPVLYLLDSVAKNLRAVYAPLFERNLPEIYIRALEAAPSPGVRTSLAHLRATWKDVFPAVRPRTLPLLRACAVSVTRSRGERTHKQTQPLPRVPKPSEHTTRQRGRTARRTHTPSPRPDAPFPTRMMAS